MKKLISFVMAAVLCVGMTTVVMAEQSPTTEVIANESSNFDNEEAAEWINVAGADGEISADEVVAVASEAGVTLTVASVDDVAVYDIDSAEVTDNGNGTKTAERTVTVDPAYDYTWKAFVYDKANDKWDEADVVYANGKISITSTHFCPTIVVAEKTLKQTTPVTPTPQPQPTTPVAPKTADVAMFGMVAMAALAGTVTAARKAKESK